MATAKYNIPPPIRSELTQIGKALSGDIIWTLTPATVAPAPTAAAWTRTILVELTAADGTVHDWFNDSITTGVAIADASTAGTATIPSTTLVIVNGKAEIVVSGDAAAWLDTETDTLTVAQATILGYTVAAATSVETFTA